MDSVPAPPSSPRWSLWCLLVLTLLIRGGAMWWWAGNLDADTDDYREIARNMHVEGSFAMAHTDVPQTTAYRPPLYPVLLYPIEFLADDRVVIAVLHVLLGVATVYGVVRLGELCELPAWAYLLAGALVACDPLLLNLSTRVLTETLAALLTVWTLVALAQTARGPTLLRAAGAGILLGLCSLCRPTYLVWLGGVGLVMPWMFRRERPWHMTFALALAAMVTLAPWTVRNYLVFGRPIVTTTHGGYTVLLGNNPSFYEFVREDLFLGQWNPESFFRWWNAERVLIDSPRGPIMDELASDRRASDLAKATMRGDPGTFMVACLVRVGWLWGVMPHEVDAENRGRAMRYAVAVWYAIELLLAALGLLTLGRRGIDSPWIWALLLLLSFTAVHSLYWTDMRMRAPLMGVVALLAARGVVLLATRARGATPVTHAV